MQIKEKSSSILEICKEEMMKKAKKIYVAIPQPEVYYGLVVDSKTKLEFKNDFVEQKIENLVLYTEQHIKKETYETEVKTKLFLQEGDLLLLEEEARGYFKPSEVKFGSIDEAIKEMRFIKSQIKKVKE
jgi:hypothetical protein